jgi:hypothetical protein
MFASTTRRRIVAEQEESTGENLRDATVRARSLEHPRSDEGGQFLLQMLGEELGGAVPGELRALNVVVPPCFVAEGVTGVIPVGLK